MRRQLAQLSRQLTATAEAGVAGGCTPSTSGRVLEYSTPALRWLASTAGSRAATAVTAASTAAAQSEAPPSAMRRLRQAVRNYKQLSKFRLSALVVATAAAGYGAGSKEKIDWAGLGWTSLGTFLASSSANALNQIYEVVNDGRMRRTAARPLPTGRMTRMHALAFAVLAGTSGVWLLAEKVRRGVGVGGGLGRRSIVLGGSWCAFAQCCVEIRACRHRFACPAPPPRPMLQTNGTTAALGAANIILYAAVYTPLKQISIANTWVGAIVGAVPPLMGWAAAAGGLDVGAGILAAGLYFWQMPHFMALAWMCRADYAAGGYRMLSLVDATGRRTAACALRNTAYLFPLGILAAWLGVTSPYFAYESCEFEAVLLCGWRLGQCSVCCV